MINVGNLSSSPAPTKSKFELTQLKGVVRNDKTRTITRTRNNDVLVNYMIFYDDGGFHIYYGSKERKKSYIQYSKELYCDCEYIFSHPKNDYYKNKYACRKSNLPYEKFIEVNQGEDKWSIFCPGMRIKGYWKNNYLIPDTDSINEWATEYYKKSII